MSTEVVGSNVPREASDQLTTPSGRKNGVYGQNQYGGPSSLTPKDDPSIGKSGFLPGPGEAVNDQLRKVKADPLPVTYGMKDPNRK